MSDWLSSTWEANWRSFQYFNLYRLVLAALFFLALLFPTEWTARLNLLPSWPMFALTAAYTAAAVEALTAGTLIYLGLCLSIAWIMRWVERRCAIPGMIARVSGE